MILHPALETVDFGEQGYRPETLAYFEMPPKDNIFFGFDLHFLKNYEFCYMNTTNNYQDNFTRCLDEVSRSLCNLFLPVCNSTVRLLAENHALFCAMLFQPGSVFEGIPCDIIPPITDMIDPNCGGCFVIPSTGALRHIHFQDFNMYVYDHILPQFRNSTICFHHNTSITYIDASNNGDHGYPELLLALQTTTKGFNNLMVLNVSNNGITELFPNLTLNMPKITEMVLSNNQLTLAGQKETKNFRYAKFLSKLDLANNQISEVPQKILSLHKLQFLNLSHNLINGFQIVTSKNKLEMLDLSYNSITSFNTVTMDNLNKMARERQESENASLVIDLSMNSLVCTCATKTFVAWLQDCKEVNIEMRDFDNYYCLSTDNSRQKISGIDIEGLRWQCLGQNFYISLTVCTTLLACLIMSGLITFLYRKRWWMRYHYWLAKQMLRIYLNREALNKEFTYDVFVSYNEKDQEWVDEVLQPKLEVDHKLKLCLHHRDFELGANITEQIVTCIDESRKTLLLLSPNFLASTWCQFEMEIAQNKLISTGKDVLLLALLKPLQKVGISKTLKELMERKTYIQWTDNDEFGQKLFWGKLLDTVKEPQKQIFDMENDDAALV